MAASCSGSRPPPTLQSVTTYATTAIGAATNEFRPDGSRAATAIAAPARAARAMPRRSGRFTMPRGASQRPAATVEELAQHDRDAHAQAAISRASSEPRDE